MISRVRLLGRLLILLVATFLGSRSAEASGLLLYTAVGSSYVNAVQYETFASPSAHLSYVTTKGGKRSQIQLAGIIAQIPFPDAATNVSPDDAEAVISQTEIYARQYPQYAKPLQSVGELWKQQLASSVAARSRPPPVLSVSQSTNTGSIVFSEGYNSEIPLIKTKSGQMLKNVRISRFEDDKAVIFHDGGIGRLSMSDIADMSGFPADAKTAVEKAQAAVEAKRKREADRIAREKAAQERLLQIESDRIALRDL